MTDIETKLSGGHHNSLGNTEAVVAEVLAEPALFDELYNCYFSEDEVVRLRTSSAIKRVCKAQKALVIPYIDRLLDTISQIDQASTRWTLAQLFQLLEADMSDGQQQKAESIMKNNLSTQNDWIVLNTTMEVLGDWAKQNETLIDWLLPHLDRLSNDTRKSVAGRAKKIRIGFKK